MQDLRDKLVKAGLASKQKAREARTENRRKRKKQGGARADEQHQEEQQQRFERKHAEKADVAKQAQEEINRQRLLQERQNRIQNLIQHRALRKVRGNDRPFYFVDRDRRIHRFYTTFEVAASLEGGQLAIVRLDGDPRQDFAVVEEAVASRLEELDATEWILFWNKPEAGEGDLPAYGAS